MLIGPPIIQVLVFGYVATFDLNRIPYAVYDQDKGAAARQLLANFRGSPNFRDVAIVTRHAQIAPLIDSKKALLVLHVGPNFSRALSQNETAPLQAIVDGRNSNTALILLSYVNIIVQRFNQEWAAAHGRQDGAPARLQLRAWFNPNLESRWFIVPGTSVY